MSQRPRSFFAALLTALALTLVPAVTACSDEPPASLERLHGALLDALAAVLPGRFDAEQIP